MPKQKKRKQKKASARQISTEEHIAEDRAYADELRATYPVPDVGHIAVLFGFEEPRLASEKLFVPDPEQGLTRRVLLQGVVIPLLFRAGDISIGTVLETSSKFCANFLLRLVRACIDSTVPIGGEDDGHFDASLFLLYEVIEDPYCIKFMSSRKNSQLQIAVITAMATCVVRAADGHEQEFARAPHMSLAQMWRKFETGGMFRVLNLLKVLHTGCRVSRKSDPIAPDIKARLIAHLHKWLERWPLYSEDGIYTGDDPFTSDEITYGDAAEFHLMISMIKQDTSWQSYVEEVQEDIDAGDPRLRCENCRMEYTERTLKWCRRCKTVAYCGRKCQKADWKAEWSHKEFCFVTDY